MDWTENYFKKIRGLDGNAAAQRFATTGVGNSTSQSKPYGLDTVHPYFNPNTGSIVNYSDPNELMKVLNNITKMQTKMNAESAVMRIFQFEDAKDLV